jgi:outer membrane protein assembly factor BamD (BamD/ComL family)
MLKRSPLILLVLVLALGRSVAAPPTLNPNPARFAALQQKAKELEGKGDYKKAARAHHRSQVYAPDDRSRAGALRGEADDYYSAGVHGYAKDAYLKLLQSYPLYADQPHILPRLRKLAELYASGAASTLKLKDAPMAIEIYETIIQETPTASDTIGDYLRLAQLQEASGKDVEAVVTYEDLLRRHAGRPQVAAARLPFARLLIDQAKAGDGDGRLAHQARRQLAAFLRDAPPTDPNRDEAEKLLAQIDEQQAQDVYNLAIFYTKAAHRRLPAARRYLQRVVDEYPNTATADQARTVLADVFGGTGEGGKPLSDKEIEARADLSASPGLAEKVTKMLNTVPPPPEQGTPKQLPALVGGDDSGKFLLPVDDVNARD